MFDDFVEHSSSGGKQISAVNRIDAYGRRQQHAYVPVDGFEQDTLVDGEHEYDVAGGDELEALEPLYMPKLLADGSAPIFSLSSVQFSLPGDLLSLQVNNNTLAMAIEPLSLILIDLNRPAELVNVDLPRPAPDGRGSNPAIKALFGDPTGRHLLITVTTGDVFYLSTAVIATGQAGAAANTARKARPLRLRHAIACVAWAPAAPESAGATRTDVAECLLGSTDGSISTLTLPPSDDIFNLKSVSLAKTFERDHVDIFAFPGRESVGGLSFGFWKDPSTKQGNAKIPGEKRVWLLTSTATRLYESQVNVPSGNPGWHMVGKYGWAEEMFKTLRDQKSIPKSLEFADSSASKMLSSFWQTASPNSRKNSLKTVRQPKILARLTNPGIYHTEIPSERSSTMLERFQTCPYATSGQGDTNLEATVMPSSILATEFHFILLFRSHLVALSRLTQRIVWEENLNLRQGETPKGLVADDQNATFWIYTNQALYEIVVKDEDRDVWKAKLEQEDFEEALRYAKNPKQLDIVRSRQADSFFDQKRYLQAAQTYSRCSRSFEFVTLRFVDADEKDALRIYLSERLDALPKTDATQRMMLATWLVEIYLSKCNTLEDIIAAEAATSDVDSLRTELMLMEEDLRNFLTTYKANLDATVVYELIQSHGRTDIYLFYAGLLDDHDIVIQHYIDNETWLASIDVLNRQSSLDLYYRHASTLIAHATKETIECWLKRPMLEPKRLVPALLSLHRTRNSSSRAHVMRYLRTVIDRGDRERTVHNLLLTMLAQEDQADEAMLLDFLNNVADNPLTGKPYYDLDYALRTCKYNDRLLSCILIYSKMGLYENSVDLALAKDNLDLARLNANKPEDNDDLRRRLWLKIAKHVIQDRKDIKSAIQFLEQTDLLKIEDILPYFPDFTVINEFKDEICNALEDYSVHIERLRGEMDDATQSAENIKSDIENLRNRFITIDANERCSKCRAALLTRQFYAFPCQHTFHTDCLIAMAKETLPASSLRRILHLQDELVRLAKPIKYATAEQETKTRTLLSAGTAPVPVMEGIASALDPSNLLFGGSRKLLAAGDKLRELIIPDVLASAVSVVSGKGSKGERGMVANDARDQDKIDKLRAEIDQVLAMTCVLCESSITTLDRPFVTETDDDGSWDI